MYRLRASRPDTQPRTTTTPPASAQQTSGGRGEQCKRGHRKTQNGRWIPPSCGPQTIQSDDRDHKSSRGCAPTRTTTMTPTMCHKSSRSNQAGPLINIHWPHSHVPLSKFSASCLSPRTHYHLQQLFIIFAFLLSLVPISGRFMFFNLN